MSKFIITEEEKLRILNLYEQTQNSQFTQDIAAILGVAEDEISYIEGFNETLDINKRKEYFDKLEGQKKNLTFALAKLARQNLLDAVVNQLGSYSKPMGNAQKDFLNDLVVNLKATKPIYDKFKTFPEDQWNEFVQKNVTVDTPQVSNEPETSDQPSQEGDEKINTTNDRSYDYKLSGGKYYYSTKGQNNWIEAKGKGLEAIKSKIKF